jgi:uncharacterized protein (UPF0332 family)
MLAERFVVARTYLDDAQYLFAAGRLESAVSRAYYAAYQAMWAALGEPPNGRQWRHLGIISHFVRGYWFEPAHPQAGPGLLEHLRLPLSRLYQFRLDVDYDVISHSVARVEECVTIAERTITEVARRSNGALP